MELLNRRKSTVEKVIGKPGAPSLLKVAARSALESALDQPSGMGTSSALAGPGAGKRASQTGLGRVAMPGLIVAGGAASLTAASAAISAIRRHEDDDGWSPPGSDSIADGRRAPAS